MIIVIDDNVYDIPNDDIHSWVNEDSNLSGIKDGIIRKHKSRTTFNYKLCPEDVSVLMAVVMHDMTTELYAQVFMRAISEVRGKNFAGFDILYLREDITRQQIVDGSTPFDDERFTMAFDKPKDMPGLTK